MSKKAKGRRTLNKGKDYFEDNGWIVDEIEQGGRFRKYKDAFAGYCINCWERDEDECCDERELFDGFDLMGLKNGVVAFAQLKSNKPPTQRPFKEFSKMFASHAIEVWAMTWYDYEGWRIQKYKPDGTIIEKDLR